MGTFTFDSATTRLTLEIDESALCRIAQVPVQHVIGQPPYRPLASGFYFLRSDLVVTAKHVYTECRKSAGPLFVMNSHSCGDGSHLAIIETAWAHPHFDLALLRISLEHSPPDVRPLFPAHATLNQNAGYVAAGHKPSISLVTPEEAVLRTELNFVDSIRTYERERSDCEPETVIEFDAPFIEPGNSGGPLLATGGGVVGVITSVTANKIGRATSVLPLLKMFSPPIDPDRLKADLYEAIAKEFGSGLQD